MTVAGKVMFLCAFASLGCYWLLLVRLRNRHSELWESIGRPTIGMSNLSGRYWKLMGFLWGMRFFRVGDWEMTILCLCGQITSIGFLVTAFWPSR
jgi:hypothetical protein